MKYKNHSIYLDEFQWEEAKQRIPLYDQRILTEHPAFSFVKHDPALPNILLIGDSISISYTPTVRNLLTGKANVYRIPTNGGWVGRGLEYMDLWMDQLPWHTIHFNWGLHDIKRLNPSMKNQDSNPHKDPSLTTQCRTDPCEYLRGLCNLVASLKQTQAQLIWASTTPVPIGCYNWVPGDENEYNQLAEDIMKDQQIDTNDLHSAVLPHLKCYQHPVDVHFNHAGAAFLGKQVVSAIGISHQDDVQNQLLTY